ncbi:MAG: corrinoid protein [Dehalobacterium sp.]
MLEKITDAIRELEKDKAIGLIKKALDSGIAPLDIINKGVIVGIKQVGDLFEKEEYFLPELMMVGDLAKEIMNYMEPFLPPKTEGNKKVVVASVEGDLHDLGKNLVVLMMQTGGYEVLDLGIDVPLQTIINKATEFGATVIGLSALMVTTMPNQRALINQLKDAGLRDKFKVIVGGAPTTQEWADQIGADGWALDAAQSVKLLDKLFS